jgi:Zn-dependent M28 family amino/carboxypeptidase
MKPAAPWIACTSVVMCTLPACRSGAPHAESYSPPSATAADERSVRNDLQYLSSDELEGRGTGQRGGDMAANYIRGRFQSIRLGPAGERGTFFQKVPLVGLQTEPSTSLGFGGAASGLSPRYLDDFIVGSEIQEPSVSADGDLVFVGYGIQAPEVGWDDYKGMDVRGRFLLMLVNDPPSDDPSFFGGKGLTYYGRWTYKYEIAARLGAAGALLVHTPQTAGYGWEVVRNSWGRERPFVKLEPGTRALAASGWLTERTTRDLLRAAGQDLDRLFAAAATAEFRPVSLPVTARIRQTVRPIRTQNVVGRFPGTDPRLRDEAVIVCAHYDHLGVGHPVDGDAIYNGCVDNASGVAALLHTARLVVAADPPPRRSILFIALAAEEGGLRGSEFFARNPTIPADRLAAVVNMDGLSVHGRTRDVTFLGADRSTLREITERVAADMGLRIVPDEHPEQGFLYRSDQFSFAKVGIPALAIEPGSEYEGKPPDFGKRLFEEYKEKRYHRPSDEYDPSFDMSGIIQAAEIAARIAIEVARSDAMPEWNPEDEFAAARRRVRATQ